MNIHVRFTAYNLATRAIVGSFQEAGDSALDEGDPARRKRWQAPCLVTR